MEQERAAMAPSPDPRVVEIRNLRDTLSRSKSHMTALMTAIQRDLAAIRSKCKECDCPKDVPGTDCPNMAMHKTMSALVHITLENMEG